MSTDKKVEQDQKDGMGLNPVQKQVMCTNCEESVTFVKRRCVNCGGKYDDVVPASYRNYKFDYGKVTA